MNKKIPCSMLVMGAVLMGSVGAQQGSVVGPDAVRMAASYESGYQSRVATLLQGKNNGIWGYGSGASGTDVGKSDWPGFLATLYKKSSDTLALQKLINGDGKVLLSSSYAGSFYKAFSCPGLAMYYFEYKDKLQPAHIEEVKRTLNTVKGSGGGTETGWECLMRADRYMDPMYTVTEKNSENFSWMARMAGLQFAHEFNSTHKSFFETFMNNLTRATFSIGRVEWDSNNYFGYCFQPLLTLFEHPPTQKIKLQAQAMLDWMVITAALHYLDGALVGPDVRAKGNDYVPFSGAFWPYGYAYFGHENPGFTTQDIQNKMSVNLTGWLPYTSYRPPQVALDIAARKFATPVEMHNAKPFYQADFEEYKDWQGNTVRSRRFEFETLFLEDNYTLGSVASNVPDGRTAGAGGIDCFSEERLWMLGVKGPRGALKIHGKSGTGSISTDNQIAGYWGRNPYEEIGQYRNVMMRLVKGVDLLWVVIPTVGAPALDNGIVFADMGSDVYVAIRPYAYTGVSEGMLKNDTTNAVFKWTFDKSKLGALVLEVGTKKEHGSFANFKTSINNKAKFTAEGVSTLSYSSTANRVLKMEFVAPGSSYSYWDKTKSPVIHPIAGTVAKVWRDGQAVDFSSWDSYRVVAGEQIVQQVWGSAQMSAAANGKGVQISINPQSAEVQYRSVSGGVGAKRTTMLTPQTITASAIRYCGATRSVLLPKLSGPTHVSLIDMQGRRMVSCQLSVGCQSIAVPALAAGVYVVEMKTEGTTHTIRHPFLLPK